MYNRGMLNKSKELNNMKKKYKMPTLHKEAKKKRNIVRFYNDPQRANRLSHGYHHFQVGQIGWKWVKVRPAVLSTYRKNNWTKIKRSTWDNIQSCKTFTVLEVA